MNQNNFDFKKEELSKTIIKIADFGITTELGSKLASTRAGTSLYMAPVYIL